ncbi:hypothetical protein FRC98_09530 [Lujinxingia vulgaris]|uniref:Uncharacterized protein n=1 Tax=Lujinxingia vulgaris TaxID=2600176 RepID=A0A5C6XI77_9DELT|nr:hypothetical protein [Lujinxingia vulgaris]TXD36972.1 hypothetical protein FRC98_09530 [Lujinxingia vulgaris]
MAHQLTERELQAFSLAGYPYPVERPEEPVTLDELARVVVRVMENPGARAVEASVMALVMMAQLDALEMLECEDVEARRRLGYVAQRLSTMEGVPARAQKRLRELVTRLRGFAAGGRALFLTSVVSRGRAERLERSADDVSRFWGVYGEVVWRGRDLE